MAFSEADRVYIRKYLGFGSLFTQRDPRLESAIKAIQSVADGGSQPDSSSENELKALIYGAAAVTGTAGITPGSPVPVDTTTVAQPTRRGLLQVEHRLAQLDVFAGTTEVGKGAVKANAARETGRLRAEGRRLVGQMARMLDTYPRTDCFATPPLLEDAAPDYPRSPY